MVPLKKISTMTKRWIFQMIVSRVAWTHKVYACFVELLQYFHSSMCRDPWHRFNPFRLGSEDPRRTWCCFPRESAKIHWGEKGVLLKWLLFVVSEHCVVCSCRSELTGHHTGRSYFRAGDRWLPQLTWVSKWKRQELAWQRWCYPDRG